MREININRQLLGIEDLLFGFGQVTQTRAGQSVDITKINAGNLPFDETQTLIQWAQNVNLAELGAMTVELQAIYNSIDALNSLEDNLVALNTLALAINCLNNLCTNLSKLQNIDTNMLKLQNIDTNMTKLQNIDTNMTKLQNIDTNMLQLSSIYTNMVSLQNIYTNMSSLLNINSQIIPHLSEILLVDDYATQVALDKNTVASDKASVASMKLAIETIYDTFDDRFLGTKPSDPTLDNDGNPLIDGAMYFNTSVNALKVYDLGNATWLTIPQIYLSSLLDVTLTSITTGDILTWNGSKWINTRTPSFDSIKLNGGTGTNGTATWNNAEYTYDIVLNPNVTLQVGQEDLVYCKNNSASVIANGRPVMASGTNGNSGNILVDLHDGTKANARRIVGITTEDLTANGYGFVTRNGKVRGINTTGSQYGETWIDGDILYVKATGNLTKVEPADTALKMPIAFVIHAHANGTLYIRTTGIDENHDRDFINNLVDIHSKTAKTTLVDADEFMTADSTSSFSLKKITWASIKTLLTSLFIPKVTSTDNAVVRFNGTTGEVQNSGVIIDDNGNVGIGTSSPVTSLSVNTASETKCALYLQKNLSSVALLGAESTWLGTGTSNNAVLAAYGTNSLILGTNGSERMRIDTAGNVGIRTTPSAWNTITPIQIKNASLGGYSNYLYLNSNTFYDGVWKYIANDNAARYQQTSGKHEWYTAPSGTAGNAITWTNAMTLDVNGNLLLTSATGGLGYGTGAGGVVTQLTSKGTAVTLNKPSGVIVMNNAALAAGARVEFILYSSLISDKDTISVAIMGGTVEPRNYRVEHVNSVIGAAYIRLSNLYSGSLSEAIGIQYNIIKGAQA